ncbi:MAG: putative ribosomal small subunit pseudouridine synthase A [Osedax symbiont Rs2]|nr:MAG: putative ribosomal small subunit pseudouridine synthase A [Osedax symbiont Rs2]
MRLDKFLCKSSEHSRSQARHLIAAGAGTVNSLKTVDPAQQVHENNCIILNGQILLARPSRYIMLHKPANSICSNVDEGYPSIFNYIDVPAVDDLHIVGRLDTDTTGLVLVTDDGRWSFNIIRPQQRCEKVYLVDLRSPISADVTEKFSTGLLLHGEKSLTLPAKLEVLGPRQVRLTITQGKYHQVKRMFAAVGNKVVKLHRQQIGSLALDVQESDWRYLSSAEIASFNL